MRLPTRYSVIDTGESGGFGRVVRARDKWLDRDIAIKILDPIRALEEAEQERFLQEAKTLARLSHPSIPSIYDVVFEDANAASEPLFQIIFEYIHGPSLRSWMEENGVVPIEKAKDWFTELASALAQAHQLGIVHRDIKPENILIQASTDSCALVDWGIAIRPEEAKRLTKTGFVIGTPGYMSPEQQTGDRLDGRTDIYNLGLVLYEALSGGLPAPNDYRNLAQVDETVPMAVDELIMACLAERELRIDTPEEFARALNAAIVTRLSLGSVLTAGTLSDLQNTLRGMDALEFAEHQAGTRALVLDKAADLAASGNEKLELPLVGILVQLVRVATRTDPVQYGEVVDLALTWGFNHQYRNGEFGKAQLRRAIAAEGPALAPGTFRATAELVVSFFEPIDLSAWDYPRLVGSRELVDGLLANRSCGDDYAKSLSSIRRRIDKAQRELPAPGTTVR